MPIEEPYNLIKKVEEGNLKASNAYVTLRALKSEIEYAIKQIESQIIDELTYLDSKEALVVNGYKITHVAGRTSYDYKESSMWKEADTEKKRIERLIKVATKDGVSIVDQHTGEVIEPVQIKQGAGFIKMEQSPTPLIDIIK
jgi:hypothetical protein